MAEQDEQEKTRSAQRTELRFEVEQALLEAIKAEAGKSPSPESLRDLSEAFSALVSVKVVAPKDDGEGGRSGGRRSALLN